MPSVFLLPQLVAADHDRLRGFRRLFDGTSLSPVNVVGVLSKADRVGDPGTDPVVRAHELVAKYAVLLNDVAATVVPVVGLLAETSDADRFTERDAEDLRRLASAPLDDAGRVARLGGVVHQHRRSTRCRANDASGCSPNSICTACELVLDAIENGMTAPPVSSSSCPHSLGNRRSSTGCRAALRTSR